MQNPLPTLDQGAQQETVPANIIEEIQHYNQDQDYVEPDAVRPMTSPRKDYWWESQPLGVGEEGAEAAAGQNPDNTAGRLLLYLFMTLQWVGGWGFFFFRRRLVPSI